MPSWDNECLASSAWSLQPPTPNAPATFLPYCAEWVINTTDKVWLPDRTPAQVTEALHEHFYAEWESTSNGKYFRGMRVLEQLVEATRTAFPDLKIHITDVFCVGNDIDGYKTIMPDVLVGTHLGPSAMFGPPTGKTATWSGMALCYVQNVGGRWQYVAEWVVHDELAAALQLGATWQRWRRTSARRWRQRTTARPTCRHGAGSRRRRPRAPSLPPPRGASAASPACSRARSS